jgi:uncharacterized protein (TIGR03083 family)
VQTPVVNELVVEAEAAWRRFRETVSRLTPVQLESPTATGWTAKEMLGHLAFWAEATEGVIVGMFRGEPLRPDFAFGSGYEPDENAPWPIADVHNAREAAWATPRPADEVIARLDAGHDRYVELLKSLTPDELADPRFQGYVDDVCVELDAHRDELLALLGDRAGA